MLRIRPLTSGAWSYRHNMTTGDALCVVLVEQLPAHFLTDNHNPVDTPKFPRSVNVLRLPLGR